MKKQLPEQLRLLIAFSLYITSILAANTLGVKLMPFIFGTHLSVAVFFFPVVFLMTDVVGEIFGKKTARYFVLAGFVAVATWIAYSFLSVAMPWSESSLWVREGYNQVFGLSIRIAIGSVVAFGIAEYQDVISFFFFRKRFGAKNFWLRSNLSNIWSQLLDTTIFMFIAFIGVYSIPTIVQIILPWWLYKVAMGAVYTPISYLGLRLLRRPAEVHGN